MASDTMANGNSSTEGMTNAERLMQQHADEAHKVTVEDVPDEDLPRPSTTAFAAPSTEVSQAPASAEPTMSEKAVGKQPAREQAQAPKKPAFDTQSEELFPSLGAPKSQSAAAPTMWSKKPAAVGKAAGGMSNGAANGASVPSSRTSIPASGVMTPTSSTPSQRIPGQMTLPGRYSESINLHPSMLTPRNQLKKPVADILRDINKRSKAHIEEKAGPNGTVRFEGTGPVDAVRVALKEAAGQLCAKVCGDLLAITCLHTDKNSKTPLSQSRPRSVAELLASKALPSRRSRRSRELRLTSRSKRRLKYSRMTIWTAPLM